MSRLDNLAPDLHAALALVLRQHKSYAELATLLGIEAYAVHDRAHAALALLAPREARGLSSAEREQIGEYILGQQAPDARSATRQELQLSPAARAWAQALAAELAPLSPHDFDIPAPAAPPSTPAPPPVAPAPSATPTPAGAARPATASSPARTSGASSPAQPPAAARAGAPSSRRGGAILLGAIALAVVVVVLFVVVGVGGGSSHSGTTGAKASAQRTSTSTGKGSHATGTGATGSGATGPTGATGPSSSVSTHSKALPLTPPAASGSKALGVAYVLSEKGQRAFYVFTKGLPTPATGSFYAVWLEGSSGAAAYPLGSLPAAGSDGLIEGGGPLPENASSYTRIIVTLETSHKPSHPGPTVLGGKFALS